MKDYHMAREKSSRKDTDFQSMNRGDVMNYRLQPRENNSTMMSTNGDNDTTMQTCMNQTGGNTREMPSNQQLGVSLSRMSSREKTCSNLVNN